MKVALAQLNVTVGDLSGNADRIITEARRAHALGAQCVLTPELSLCGYPPEDLLLRPAFLAACDTELQRIAARWRTAPACTWWWATRWRWGRGRVSGGWSVPAA